MKLKAGTRVIVTTKRYGTMWEGPGEVESDYAGVGTILIHMDNEQVGGFSEGEYELDVLYDSPLGKALR